MRGCVLGALIALLLAAGTADAADVTTRGSLAVRWHSNPATCAEHGLCDRSGVLSWRPESHYASLDLIDANFAFLSLYSTQAVSRSHRGDQVCIDRVTGPSELVASPDASGKAFVFSMQQASEQLGFGRCAGPLGPDFASALPQSPPVKTAALRRGTLIDLRARTPFSSGPFEGEVISTLTLRTEREGAPEGGGSTGTTRPHTRLVRFGSVSASYAIESLSGDAGYSFSGPAEPECGPFDTCGLVGDLMLHPNLTQGSITFDAIRRLPTGHETVASGLSALRQGRARGFGDATLGPPFNPDRDEEEPSVAFPLTASATPGGGATCSDTGSYTQPDLNIDRRKGGFAIALQHGGNTQPDPLRTHCPGPGTDDRAPLARATIPASAIGQPRIELTMKPAAGFVMPGFRLSGSGELKLSLRLTSIRALTRRIRVESGGLFE